MRSWIKRLTLALLLVVLCASTTEAQRRGRARGRALVVSSGPTIGLRLGYNFDVEELLIGAQLSLPISPRLAFYPSFDYYLVDRGTLWSLNADLKYRPPTRSGAFYFGGGLNISRRSVLGAGDTDTGLNLLGGLAGRGARVHPFVEAKLVLDGGSAFQIVGGLNFRLR